MKKIIIDGFIFSYSIVVNKSQKANCIVRVTRDKNVVVTTNGSLSVIEVENVLKNKLDFIKERLHKTIDKNIIHVQGIGYTPIFVIDTTSYVKISYNHIIIAAKENNVDLYKKALDDFYIGILKEEINKLLPSLKTDFKELFVPKISYKRMKGKFAECYVLEKAIVLNTDLAKYDPFNVKLTLYHEMCHFKIPNHSKAFYEYFETKIKNAKKIDLESRKVNYFDCI